MTDWAADRSKLRDRRVQYETDGLDIGDVDPDPMAQWHRWHDDAFEAGVAEPNAMTAVDRRRRRGSRCPDRAGARRRRARLHLLHQLHVGQERAAGDPTGRGAHVQLARPPPSGARARHGRPGRRRRERRVLRLAPARQPARRVGVAAVAADRRSRRARAACRRGRARFAGVDVPRPPHWGGWRITPDRVGVLAGPPEPPPRPPALPAAAGDGWTVDRLAP